MKLLHLNEFYAVVGGLEQYLLALCDASEAAGHPTAVVYCAVTGREPRDRARAAYHVPGLAGPAPAPRAALERLSAILATEAPDVVVLHEILAPEVAQVVTRVAPTVRFCHGFKLTCPGGRRVWNRSAQVCARSVGLACQAWAYLERCMPRDPRQGLPLIARTARLAAIHRAESEVVVASEFMRQILVGNGFAGERVHVVPYFTDVPGRDADVPGRDDLAADWVPGRLLCAARLVPEKGVDHSLRALASLPPPAHLVIAGDGHERGDLDRLASSLGVGGRVTFAGWLGREAMAKALRDAQVVVVPSLWPEPFGISGIEAMACARPVVAYDVGGVREWLAPDVTGLLVPPRDVPALARALGSILGDPARARAMGARGRAIVESRFRARRHLEDFLAVAATARQRWLDRNGKRG